MNGWLGSGYKDECKLFVERHYFSAVYRFLPFEQRHSGEGGGWWYDVLYFGGVVLSPFQLVGTMLSHGAPGNLGEKFHPARPEASNPYGAGNFSPVQTSSPISPLSRRLRKPGYRFTEWARSWKDRASPLLVEEDEVFRTDPFMLAWFFRLIPFFQHVVTRIWK